MTKASGPARQEAANASPTGEIGEFEAVLDLQETAGNRAVVQLLTGGTSPTLPTSDNGLPVVRSRSLGAVLSRQIATARPATVQREMSVHTDPELRVAMLRDAIRFDPLFYRFVIDGDKTTEALSNLTPEDGRAVKSQFKTQKGWNLAWIFSAVEQPIEDRPPAANNLSQADRTKFLNMLAGTATKPAAPAAAPGPASLPGGGEAAPAAPAPDPDAARVAKNRLRVTAASIRSAVARKDVKTAIALIPTSMEERREVDDIYRAMHGETAYMALFTKLPGKHGQRAAALWYDERDDADRLALEAATDERDKANREAEEIEKVGILAPLAKAKRKEGREKVESAVRQVAQSGDQGSVAGREAGRARLKKALADPKGGLARKIDVSAGITKAIAEGDEAAELAGRLARADEASDVSAAEVESTLRSLRQLATDAADREIDADPEKLEPVAEQVTKNRIDDYYDRFVTSFNNQQKRRSFDLVVSGHGGTDEKAAKLVGISVDDMREISGKSSDLLRNKQLLASKGELPEWQEVFYALNRDPKDIERVRSILESKTYTEVQALAHDYMIHTGLRSLEMDLAGTDAEQAFAQAMGGELKESLQDRRVLLGGGRFDRDSAEARVPADLVGDQREAHLLKAEGAFLSGRIAALERRVIENRGYFAQVRDWSGNEEKSILDLASVAATRATSGLANALTPDQGTTWQPGEEGKLRGPNIGEAKRHVAELRRIEARMNHAVTIYKEATKKAYEEFVDLVVNAATIAAGLGVTGIWITALRTTVATVGTKVLMKGNDYSVDEFLGDIQGGMAGVAGDFAKLGFKQFVAPYVVSKIIRHARRVGMSKAFIAKVQAQVGPLAMRQAEHTIGTGVSNVTQGKSWTEGQGIGERVKGEAIGAVTGPIDDGMKARRAAAKRQGASGGAAEGPVTSARPATDDATAPVRAATGADGGPATATPAAGPDEAGAAPTRSDTSDDVETTPPATSMALPEPTAPRPRTRSVPPPIPEAAANPKGRRFASGGQQPAGQTQTTRDQMAAWTEPDTTSFIPAMSVNASGEQVVLSNVLVHPDIESQVPMPALLTELDRTPYGSRIADNVRDGRLQLVIVPHGPAFPVGGIHVASSGKAYVGWRGSLQETASAGVHEGSHDLDPTTRDVGPGSASGTGIEAEARAFEYEYRQVAGLPAHEPAEIAYRKAYADEENRTAGTQPKSDDNPKGADLVSARIKADMAIVAAIEADPARYAVEGTEDDRKAARHDPELVSDRIDRMGWPEPPPPPDTLDIETMFGDEPTRADITPAHDGGGGRKPAPDPSEWQDAPRRSRSERPRGAAGENADARDSARPSPATKRPGGTMPAKTPYQAPPDAGLVGDKENPGRKAKILPAAAYEAADRPLSKAEESTILDRQKDMRAAILTKLQGMDSGKDSGYDASELSRAKLTLADQAGQGTNGEVLQHVDEVWNAVHDPGLLADVLSQMYGESLRRPGSGTGLDPLTKAILREAALTGPLHVAPPRVNIEDPEFFIHWVSTGRRWLDLGAPANHGETIHLIQDLVVDAHFKRIGSKMTAQQFRQLLGGIKVSGNEPIQGQPGNRLWIALYDAGVGINTPEKLMPALWSIPGLETLR